MFTPTPRRKEKGGKKGGRLGEATLWVVSFLANRLPPHGSLEVSVRDGWSGHLAWPGVTRNCAWNVAQGIFA